MVNMLNIAMDEGAKENTTDPFQCTGIYAKTFYLWKKPHLRPKHNPDNQHGQYRISYDSRGISELLLIVHP